MPELKDFLKELDLPEELADKDISDIKEAFHGSYLSKAVAVKDPEIIHKITGVRMGAIDTLLNTEFGLSKSETDKLKVEDKIKLASKTYKEKIAELEASGNQPNDEKFTELQKKFEKESAEKNQFKDLVKELKETLATKETEFTNTIKSKTRDLQLKEIRSKIQLVDNADPYKLRGVDAEIADKYVFDLDETDKAIAKDKAGNFIQNEKKTGFYTPEDVFKMEYQKAGLLKMNDGKTPPVNKKAPAATETTIPGRKLPESAVRNANRA